MQAEWINPFIEATVRALEMMAGMKPIRRSVEVREDYRLLGDISGIIGLSGHATGYVAVSLPATLAPKVVGAMIGDEPEAGLTEIVRDGIGEVINMIAGQAKTALSGTRHAFDISLPVIIIGRGHEIFDSMGSTTRPPHLVIVFEVAGEPMTIQVVLTPGRA